MNWSSAKTSFQCRLFIIFTLMTFIVTSLVCTLFVTREIHKTRQYLLDHLKQLTINLGETVRFPLYAENVPQLQRLAQQAARNPEIVGVVIKSPDGRLLVDVHSTSDAPVISQTIEVRSNKVLDSTEFLTGTDPEETEPLIGIVRMDRGTTDLSHSIRNLIAVSVSVSLAFWITVTLSCYLVLRRVTRSYTALMHGIEALQRGDYDARIDVDTEDEPGKAARAINRLTDTLRESTAENIRLQEERLDIVRKMLQAQKLESLGVMAGGIAHDFNNLLQSILGNCELAARKLASSPDPLNDIENAIEATRRAALLTKSMLTYLGKGLIVKQPLDLNDMIGKNIEMLRFATSHEYLLEMSLPPGLPPIFADEAQIQQLVMNLLSNAAESITDKPGLITLSTGIQECGNECMERSLIEEKPEAGRYVFLEIGDSGCGMDENTIARIFDPFFSTKFTGRGLGMSAVMGIMKLHNGALFVESEPGRGTKFRALFPIAGADFPVPAPEPPPPQPRQTSLPKKPISGVALVVDDEKAVLRVCTKMVELCGFKVITACNGQDAINKFRKHAAEIDLVLLDLLMPHMNGVDAMNEIYRIKPDVKVIISSGFNDEELQTRLTGQGPSGLIRKPYVMDVLEEELRRVLQE